MLKRGDCREREWSRKGEIKEERGRRALNRHSDLLLALPVDCGITGSRKQMMAPAADDHTSDTGECEGMQKRGRRHQPFKKFQKTITSSVKEMPFSALALFYA